MVVAPSEGSVDLNSGKRIDNGEWIVSLPVRGAWIEIVM